MSAQQLKWLGSVVIIGGLISALLSCSLFVTESDLPLPELDDGFYREPYTVSIMAERDSMFIRITAPDWSRLNYCVRSICGHTDGRTGKYYQSIVILVALDDTISVLWSNRLGDTLRTPVQIDRDWFTDGFVVAGDTLRIRRPKGAMGPFSVVAWGKVGSAGADTLLQRGVELLELIAPSPGDWAELHLVELMRDDFFRDTIATNPVQYVEFVRYQWKSTLYGEDRCPGCLRP